MTTRRLTGTLLAVALTGSLLAACGDGDGSEESALCGDVDALRASMSSLKSFDLRGGDKVSELTDKFDQIMTNVRKLVDDASAEYAKQVDAVQSTADDLGSSVDAAVAKPSAAAVGTVADDVSALGTAVKDLQTAVADTC